jgi:hypothetical protein
MELLSEFQFHSWKPNLLVQTEVLGFISRNIWLINPSMFSISKAQTVYKNSYLSYEHDQIIKAFVELTRMETKYIQYWLVMTVLQQELSNKNKFNSVAAYHMLTYLGI